MKFLLALASVILLAVPAFGQGDDFFTGVNLRSGSPLKFYDAGGKAQTVTSAPLAVDLSFVLPATAGSSGQVLGTDGAGHTSWVSNVTHDAFRANWATADGASKQFTHGFGTKDVVVTVFDGGTGETIHVEEKRSDNDNVILTASEAPGGSGWRVLVQAP